MCVGRLPTLAGGFSTKAWEVSYLEVSYVAATALHGSSQDRDGATEVKA